MKHLRTFKQHVNENTTESPSGFDNGYEKDKRNQSPRYKSLKDKYDADTERRIQDGETSEELYPSGRKNWPGAEDGLPQPTDF